MNSMVKQATPLAKGNNSMSPASPLPNTNPAEIAQFNAQAAQWWDPHGPQQALHVINPTRLQFIQQQLDLSGKRVLDVGCGGGILCESMAREGGQVIGIDVSEPLLDVAREHAKAQQLSIHYQLSTVEQLAQEQPHSFDVITCMELLEHVPDPVSVVHACSQLVKPGGNVFFSTLNRNLIAYMLAILGAEYLLGLVPKGTHDYRQFIKPAELAQWLRQAGLTIHNIQGITYNPLLHTSYLSKQPTVNYLVHATSMNSYEQ